MRDASTRHDKDASQQDAGDVSDSGSVDPDSGVDPQVTTCEEDPCDALTDCTDSATGRTCSECPDGYSGTGETSCTDVDECAKDNGDCGDATFYACANNVGAAPTCTDIDECTSNNGGCGDATFYACVDNEGAVASCTDIDECAYDNGGCGSATFYTCEDNVGAVPTCTDIDECATDNGDCGDAAFYTCTNNEGAVPTCEDIDECATDNGDCGDATFYTCTNNEGAVPTCEDIDECATDNGGCGSTTFYTCTNNEGAVSSCTDIDQCASNHGGCDALVTCTDNSGALPTCGACPFGYYDVNGNGTLCSDIDECADENGDCGNPAFNDCSNNVGALPTCSDIDECLTNNGGCSVGFLCVNNAGAPPTCDDIDECAVNNGNCGSATFYTCANQAGAPPICADIDECASNHGGCDALVVCTNNDGALPTCGGCPSGYDDVNADGTLCTDIDECAQSHGGCDALVTCSNNAGAPATCGDCPAGYDDVNADGTLCTDIDECASNNGGCAAGEECINQAGSVGCGACITGYVGPGYGDGCELSALEIVAGERHSCALLGDHSVRCWGNDAWGQLGLGLATASTIYSAIQTVVGLSDAEQLASGNRHNCALASDGSVRCWGYNILGQIGDSTFMNALAPTGVTGLSAFGDPRVLSIATGSSHSCAVLEDGTARCWGDNVRGQLGNDAVAPSNVPVTMLAYPTRCSYFAGVLFSCTTDYAAAPAPLHGVRAIAAGLEYTCTLGSEVIDQSSGALIQDDDLIRCTGRSNYYQQGNNSATERHAMANPVTGLPNVLATRELADLRGASETACTLTNWGDVYCWGRNSYGQVGDGSINVAQTATYANIDSVSALRLGYQHACALRSDGQVLCWGRNNYGQLGDGVAIADVYKTSPTALPLVDDAIVIGAGWGSSCTIDNDGRGRCFGYNGYGALGDGTTVNTSTPARLGLVKTGLGVALGERFSCVLDASGSMRCFGRSAEGEMASGTATVQRAPQPTALVSSATEIAAGRRHACALLEDQSVQCWGQNLYGEVGVAPAGNVLSPTTVTLSGLALDVAAGYEHSCAVIADGTVQCWGRNNNGQFGNPADTSNSAAAVTVPSVSLAVAVSAGQYHTCALRSNGRVTCWGYSAYGQAALFQPSPYRQAPTEIFGLFDVRSVSAFGMTTCALAGDNGGAQTAGVYCWGRNNLGQLGTNTLGVNNNVPTLVNLENIAAVSSDGGSTSEHICALRANGSVACWGRNLDGELGDGNLTNSGVPVDVVGLPSPVEALGNGAAHTCAVMANGRAYCWGLNNEYHLGDGSVVRRLQPVPLNNLF